MEKMDEASFDKDRIDFVNGGMGLRNFFFLLTWVFESAYVYID